MLTGYKEEVWTSFYWTECRTYMKIAVRSQLRGHRKKHSIGKTFRVLRAINRRQRWGARPLRRGNLCQVPFLDQPAFYSFYCNKVDQPVLANGEMRTKVIIKTKERMRESHLYTWIYLTDQRTKSTSCLCASRIPTTSHVFG